jgi:hypothetical protein
VYNRSIEPLRSRDGVRSSVPALEAAMAPSSLNTKACILTLEQVAPHRY